MPRRLSFSVAANCTSCAIQFGAEKGQYGVTTDPSDSGVRKSRGNPGTLFV